MARPSNDHHVHSDGYRSDQTGDTSDDARLMELSDDLRSIHGVYEADAEYDRIDVEYDGAHETLVTIEDEVREWGFSVEPVGDGWVEVRP